MSTCEICTGFRWYGANGTYVTTGKLVVSGACSSNSVSLNGTYHLGRHVVDMDASGHEIYAYQTNDILKGYQNLRFTLTCDGENLLLKLEHRALAIADTDTDVHSATVAIPMSSVTCNEVNNRVTFSTTMILPTLCNSEFNIAGTIQGRAYITSGVVASEDAVPAYVQASARPNPHAQYLPVGETRLPDAPSTPGLFEE